MRADGVDRLVAEGADAGEVSPTPPLSDCRGGQVGELGEVCSGNALTRGREVPPAPLIPTARWVRQERCGWLSVLLVWVRPILRTGVP